MAKEYKKPNAEQQNLLDEAGASFSQLYEETRAKLSAANFTTCDDDTHCLVGSCHCENFVPGHGGGPGSFKCARSGCGHPFIRHCVF